MSTIARRLRSSIKMYANGYQLRGQWITLQEAERRTGLPYHLLRQRIEDGELPAADMLCIDSASIAEEVDAAFVTSASKLMERATGEPVTDEVFERMLGTAEDRIARARGEKVSA